ncbi:MAG TPA: hypothetical protein VFO89_03110 [Thermoanaerobaculia bacterium]|nr:hypothetical protein [Thermoanaerobaculia bacterium]
MVSATPSTALSRFLQQRLTSIDQVQIVLLLRRNPARTWTAPEVAAEVGTPPESAAMRLFLLASSGVIAFEATGIPRYRYAGGDPETDALLQELAEVHEAAPGVIAAIVGAPPDPLRSFADAFKLKK